MFHPENVYTKQNPMLFMNKSTAYKVIKNSNYDINDQLSPNNEFFCYSSGVISTWPLSQKGITTNRACFSKKTIAYIVNKGIPVILINPQIVASLMFPSSRSSSSSSTSAPPEKISSFFIITCY